MIVNRRLAEVAKKAVEMKIGGGKYLLDGYNQKVLTEGISFAITTRVSASCDHFVMEIYESEDDKRGMLVQG